jgi:ribonuclease BN (tRNA processing enzyme)
MSRDPSGSVDLAGVGKIRTEEIVRHFSVFAWTCVLSLSLAALGSQSEAQTVGGAAGKTGTRLITLGTRSGPNPTIGRAQSSNLLVVNGAMYLIDSGDGVTRRLIRFGANFRNIDNIFITHPHSDHTGGLGGLMGVIYDANRTKPVNIMGPPGTDASVKGLLQFLTVSSEIRISDGGKTIPVAKIFASQDLGTGQVFHDANINVTAVENTHFNFPPGSPAYGKYKSYAYRFDTKDRSIVFTGDTGPSEAIATLAQGADLLVSEVTSVDEWKAQQVATGRWQTMNPEQQANSLRHMNDEHLTPEEVGKMATRANVKTVVLSHIPATTNPNDDYVRLGEKVRQHFSGQVFIADDLKEY